MQREAATTILQALADGVDPHTGEVFPPDSPYQNPQVIRALFHALRALEGHREAKQPKRSLPGNAGKPWTASEDALLRKRFDMGASVTEMAREHWRTEGAIRARLVRLGMVDPRSLALEDAAASRGLPNNSSDQDRRFTSPS
jgi:hypothetical protein